MPSYGNDAGLVNYLTTTGRALPVDAVPAVVRHYGTVYVDSLEDLYCGTALSVENSFPRDLYNPIPERVVQASYEAAFAYATGIPIFGDGGSAGGQVVREKVDVLEITYAAPTDGTGWWAHNRFILPLAYSLLLPFLCLPKEGGCGGGSAAFVV